MLRHSRQVLAVLIVAAVAFPTAVEAASSPQASAGPTTGTNTSGRVVDVAALPDLVAARDVAPDAAPAITATGPGPLALTTFAGKSGTLCSGVPCADPADPYVSVSSTHIVETTSESIRITDRAGRLLKETALVGFFGTGTGAGAERDARVVWDGLHSRWLATERDDNCTTGFVSVAASTGSDPTGTWTVWLFSRDGYAPDLPSIGVSTDKVAVGLRWRAMAPSGGGCTRSGAGGAGGYVFDTSSLYAGGANLPYLDLGIVASIAAWRPALAMTRGTDLHFVAATPAGAAFGFGYVRVTGTLADQTMSRSSVYDMANAGPHFPTWQPADGLGAFPPDWQPVDAVWQNGTLWTVVTESCTPPGDTAARPCVRAVGFTTGTTQSAVEDVVVGFAGQDVFGGGVGVTADGVPVVAWSQAAHGTKTVATYASYRLAGDAAHTLRTPLLVAAATGAYTGAAWGRAVGVAQDPLDPRADWISAPYSTAGGGWATAMSQVYEAGPVRYAGPDRYSTAAMVSAKTFPAGATFGTGVDAAYIAYALNFPDALAGAAAAGTIKGPVLLAATSGTLNTATRDELVRLKPKRIVILGSTGVIAADVATQLSTLAPKVDRYYGPDRFGTAAQISLHTFPAGTGFGQGVDAAYIAYAFNFPDALAGAAAAGTVKGPVLLADKGGTLNANTKTELLRLQPKKIVVLGSSGVIGDDVVAQLTPLAPKVDRFQGPDRYATAADISAKTFPAGASIGTGVDAAYIAYAFNFPDALAGAAAAGTIRGPVLLADSSGTLNAATTAELVRLKPKTIVILGSAGVIGGDVGVQLAGYVPH